VHNFMVYTLEDVPIGAYDPHRLVNLGPGHWAIDGVVATPISTKRQVTNFPR